MRCYCRPSDGDDLPAGTIKRDVRIAMPRPRDSASAEFNALKKELSKLVMEEQMRYTETEIHGFTAD